MKKLLMVCSTFPPTPLVGGLRPAMFSKYLPNHGWQPAILTRILSQDEMIQQPQMEIEGLPKLGDRIPVIFDSEDEKKFFEARNIYCKVRDIFCPDYSQPIGFVDKLLDEIKKINWPKHLSAVYGTNPDMGCLTVAAQIAKRLKIPWIADFRDIHEQDKANGFRDKILHQRIFFRRRWLLKSASEVITVSEHHAKVLGKSFSRKVHVIQNGFDPAMFYFNPSHRSEKFSIIYMGRILSEWLRDPRPLFEAIDLLLSNGFVEKEDLEIAFYGTEPSLLNDLLSSYQCKEIVRIMPRVDFKEVPEILADSCVLLTLTNRGRHGVLTTKVFEYLGVKRPILCVPGDGGELDALLNETDGGVSCSTPESVANKLKGWYDEWKRTGTVACRSNDEDVLKYSREKQAGRLADILNKACSEFNAKK